MNWYVRILSASLQCSHINWYPKRNLKLKGPKNWSEKLVTGIKNFRWYKRRLKMLYFVPIQNNLESILSGWWGRRRSSGSSRQVHGKLNEDQKMRRTREAQIPNCKKTSRLWKRNNFAVILSFIVFIKKIAFSKIKKKTRKRNKNWKIFKKATIKRRSFLNEKIPRPIKI